MTDYRQILARVAQRIREEEAVKPQKGAFVTREEYVFAIMALEQNGWIKCREIPPELCGMPQPMYRVTLTRLGRRELDAWQ